MFLEGLDELDQKIVQLLIENARMSYSELGQKTGVSRVAAKLRVQALEQRGVIEQYTAIVNPQKLSGAVSCYFELETAPGMLAEVAEALRANDTVTQIYRVTGRTKLHVLQYAPRDWAALTAGLVITVGVIVLGRFGL